MTPADDPRMFEFRSCTASSLVWDVGGYEGAWAAGMRVKYPGVRVEVYEPVAELASRIPGAFGFGLLDRDCRLMVQVAADASSAYGGVAAAAVTGDVECEFRDVVGVLGERFVSVMKLNVEGAEYDVLERLLAMGRMGQVGTLLVQFHGFVPGAERRRMNIIDGMCGTHIRRWCEPWVWERWDLCTCEVPG